MSGKEQLREEDGRGGTRFGAGRPKEALSTAQVRAMMNVARMFAKEYKKTIDMVLAEFIYDEDLPKRDRLASIKLWKDCTRIPISEGGEGDKELGPTIYLPEQKPDPAKVVKLDSVRNLDTP